MVLGKTEAFKLICTVGASITCPARQQLVQKIKHEAPYALQLAGESSQAPESPEGHIGG